MIRRTGDRIRLAHDVRRAQPKEGDPMDGRTSAWRARRIAALLFVGALVLLVAGQVALVHSAAAAPPSRKVALGVSMWDGRDLGVLDDFRRSIGGTRVAIWTIWRSWDPDGDGRFPTAAVQGARDRGATAFIWWEPFAIDASHPGASRNQTIIDGG